jgi:hypothetical protein
MASGEAGRAYWGQHIGDRKLKCAPGNTRIFSESKKMAGNLILNEYFELWMNIENILNEHWKYFEWTLKIFWMNIENIWRVFESWLNFKNFKLEITWILLENDIEEILIPESDVFFEDAVDGKDFPLKVEETESRQVHQSHACVHTCTHTKTINSKTINPKTIKYH